VSEPADKNKLIIDFLNQYRGVFLLITGIIIVSLIFGGMVYFFRDLPTSTSLPVICVLGIVSLLLCLAGISYVFVQVKLEDKTQPLGLPPGSIQSVIALSLVVLFAILSVFVLTSVGNSEMRKLSDLTAEERDSQLMKLDQGFAGWQRQADGRFTIFINDQNASARNDIGKQLIVLIGTLMTSAVSFYFGTRATIAGSATLGGDGTARPQNGPAQPDTPGPVTSSDTAAGPEAEPRNSAVDQGG
jgi:hypothetical protein